MLHIVSVVYLFVNGLQELICLIMFPSLVVVYSLYLGPIEEQQ